MNEDDLYHLGPRYSSFKEDIKRWPKPYCKFRHTNFNPHILQKLQWFFNEDLLLAGSHSINIFNLISHTLLDLGEIDPWHISVEDSKLVCAERGPYTTTDSESYELFEWYIKEWNLEEYPTTNLLTRYSIEAHSRGLIIDTNNQGMLSLSTRNELKLIKMNDYSEVIETELDGPLESLRFSACGKFLSLVDIENILHIFETTNLKPVWSSHGPIGLHYTFLPENQLVIYHNPEQSNYLTVEKMNEETKYNIHVGWPNERIKSITINPTNMTISTASSWEGSFQYPIGYLRFFDLSGNQTNFYHFDYLRGPSPIHVRFSPNGKHFAAVCMDGNIRIWNFELDNIH